MSRKVKRTVTSTSYSINRLYQKVSTAKPSTLILSAVAVATTIFLFGGGLYDIIMKPYPAVYYSGRFLILYPQLSEQFISDSIIAMTLYSLGVVGLIVMYQSTKYAYKPRQAYMMFFIGLTLLFLAYIILEAVIHIKISG